MYLGCFFIDELKLNLDCDFRVSAGVAPVIGGGSASGTVVGGVPPLPPRGIPPGGGGYRLFGANLEVVLDHEQTPYQVPLIVKRCIDEVEKRGLDIIGLYRLCGAETKKNMLRAAFEESPEMVDLSSENVPDINVITSKLNNKTIDFKGKYSRAGVLRKKNRRRENFL